MINETILDILKMTKEHEDAPSWALGMKLSEEVGEVNEVLLYDNGFLRHKQIKEDVLHEVADVLNVCLGLLTQHYPNEEPEDLMNLLTFALSKKAAKYKHVLDQHHAELERIEDSGC